MFQLVDSPRIFPQRSLTGGTVGPMVDTQVLLPKGGRVYITELEAGEIGRHFGMLSVDAARQKDEHIQQLQHDLAEAQRRLAAIRDNVTEAVAV